MYNDVYMYMHGVYTRVCAHSVCGQILCTLTSTRPEFFFTINCLSVFVVFHVHKSSILRQDTACFLCKVFKTVNKPSAVNIVEK